VIEEAQVEVHEADEPDAVSDFPDTDALTGEGGTEIDFARAEAQAAALRDRDGAIVEGIVELWQAGVGAR
jgi:hypothetical protein